MTKKTTRPDPQDLPDDERELLADDDHAEARPYQDGDRQEDGL